MRTISKKVTEDGKYHYRLVKFSDKYVIFRNQSNQSLKEAEFGETMSEFTDEKKAKNFFDKIKL